MKNGIMNKIKWFIVSALIIVVVGLTIAGIFGLNSPIDYSDGYEVSVSIEFDDDNSKAILKSETEKYLENNDIEVVSYQILEDGLTIIYKLKTDPSAKVAGLKSAIETKLNANPSSQGNQATVVASQVYKGSYMQPLQMLLAYGIGIVAIFIFMLIMNKLASALAVVASSFASIVLFLSIMAITRIPAVPFVEISLMIAGMLGAMLSVTTVGRYREELKDNLSEKFSTKAIADSVAKTEFKKYLFILIGVLIASVAVFAFFTPYLMILGGQIGFAGISACLSAYFITPLVWSLVKSKHKNAK